GAARKLRRLYLDRTRPVEAGVACFAPRAHPPATDACAEDVGAAPLSSPARRPIGFEEPRRWCREESGGPFVRLQHALDLAAQRAVATARRRQVRVALGNREAKRALKQLPDTRPLVGSN